MFRFSTIIRELALNLAKVMFMLKHSVKLLQYLLCCCVAACCHTTLLEIACCNSVITLNLPFFYVKAYGL